MRDILRVGLFSNKYMQYAFLSSLLVLVAIIYLPFLGPVFNTTALGLGEWLVMVPLVLVPAVTAEVWKGWLRRGSRQQVRGRIGVS